MKRLLRLAVRLYPRWWRQRYAIEFEALLEDANPGWRGLLDILNGALAMHMKTFGRLPVACALAGALIGGIMATRTPTVFASSATIRLPAPAGAPLAPNVEQVKATLGKALSASGGTLKATRVTMRHSDSPQPILKLTYEHRDPAEAQRIAWSLTAAMTADASHSAAELLVEPNLPTSPVDRRGPRALASGGVGGLVAGGLLGLLLQLRRRPATSG